MERRDETGEAHDRAESVRSARRAGWMGFVVALPLAGLGVPLTYHLPLTHAQVSALRTVISGYVLLLATAALVWVTRTTRRYPVQVRRRWGVRIFAVGIYGLFVPFYFMSIAYLLTGSIKDDRLSIVLTGGAIAVSSALLFIGLLVGLAESGMDPTVQ